MTRSQIHSSIFDRASRMPRFDGPPQHYAEIMARLICEDEGDGAVVRAVLNGGNVMSPVLWVLTNTAIYELEGGTDPVTSLRIPFERLGTVVAEDSPLRKGQQDIAIFHTRGVITSTRCDFRSAEHFCTEVERMHAWHLANSPDVPLSCLPVEQVSTAYGLPAGASHAWLLVSYRDRVVLRTGSDETSDVVIGLGTVDDLDCGFHANGGPSVRIRGAGFELVAHVPLRPGTIEGILRPRMVEISPDHAVSLLSGEGAFTVVDFEETQQVLLAAR